MPTKQLNITRHVGTPFKIKNLEIGVIVRILDNWAKECVVVKANNGVIVCLWAPKKLITTNFSPFDATWTSPHFTVGRLSHRERIIVTSNYPSVGEINPIDLKIGQLARITQPHDRKAIVTKIFGGTLLVLASGPSFSQPYSTYSQFSDFSMATLPKKLQIRLAN